jgi:predicted nucleic-acid-binding protein
MNIYYFIKRWPKSGDRARSEKILSVIETLLNANH